MAIDMSQFYQVFFEESAEHLETMESLLLALDIESPDAEDLNAIFRAAHSIKGSAGTFGFTDLAETTHILENLLDRIRKQELELRPEMVDAFLEAGDLLKAMLEGHQGQEGAAPEAVEAMCERLRELSGESKHAPASVNGAAGQGSTTSGPKVYEITFVPTAVAASGMGVVNLLTDLQTFGALEIMAEPQEGGQKQGFYRLRLETNRPEADFSEHIDFIAESGAWRITEGSTSVVAEETAYGLFGEAPAAQGDDDAYGFFEPVSALVAAPAVQAEETYGFFEPLVAPPSVPESALGAVPASAEDGSYGFFAPLPVRQAETVTSPSPANADTSMAEEGDGYGFFVKPSPPLATSEATPTVVTQLGAKVAQVDVAVEPATKGASARLAKTTASAADPSIRVNVEKVDQLINLVGELVITQAMLLQTAAQLGEEAPERLVFGLAQLERNTRDLQESVMSIRMLPISAVFSRFPRVVRDLSGKLGKQVELKTIGESTELDKGLIERIADPLTHLIRNSLDHGIELPEQREAAGKSPSGTITLKAYHQGGNIVIEVGDDGAGLNRQKILAKARERGLPASDSMSDQEVFALIFEAGFSTADAITDVSGRGVGMDVVRRNIQAMGGRVEIESMLGIGTRMTVRLPLTLAILDGMSVQVASQIYILPLSYVVESLQPKLADIKTLSNQARVVQVRGEYLPVIVLHEVFGLPSDALIEQGIMVILDADGMKAALCVDALLGQHQVVIKSLEANYRRVNGVSGATIMGDGHVAMILDVPAIVGMAKTTLQKMPVSGKEA